MKNDSSPSPSRVERIDKILTHFYGHQFGAHKNAAITELIEDLKHLCKLEGRDFSSLVDPTTKDFTDTQLEEFGNSFGQMLRMRHDIEHRARWQTSLGTKTGLGLFRTLSHMMGRIERGENPFV